MAGKDPREPDEVEDEAPLIETDEGADAGQIDDEGGDDAETGQELEGDQTQERVDRRARRDDQLREELRAEREHRARVDAELAQIRAERQQAQQARQQPQEESEEVFAARISHLDPLQQMDMKLQRATRRHEQQIALATFAAADRADKAAYDSRAAVDSLYQKHAQAVEATMADARRRGMDINRETALDFVIGRTSRMNRGKTEQVRQQGQQRIAQQQARTTGARGDAQREQRPRRFAASDMSPEAVRARLEAPDAFI